jgi:long-chain acyl-CoA synthetase
MNVPYCLRRAERFHGNNVAIYQEDARVTYRELAANVACSARKLSEAGAGKGDRVALLMLNSPEYLDFYFSVPLTGAMLVPLNTRWHRNEFVFTLADSGSKILLVDDHFTALVPQIRDSLPKLETYIYVGAGECPQGLVDWRDIQPGRIAASFQFDDPHEDDIAGLFYTSGTTGGPKGAMLTHRNLYSNAIHGMLPPVVVSSDSIYLHAAPMFHLADAGSVYGLTLIGAGHCFIPTFEPEATMRAIERYRVSRTVLVPAMLNMILNHPNFAKYDLSSLDRVTYGASPMPLPLLRQAMGALPNCQFYQGYGMTELSPLATVLFPEDHRFENVDRDFSPVKSAGKPVVGVEVRVVDAQDRDVPVGQAGEVIARGPNVMKGYWNRPEINADVLRGGWMHTGDIGAFDEEGFLYLLDRKKDMIKTGSENVYSPEVESTVCAHPAVLEAAVIGIPDERWGEAVRAVVAVRPGATLTEAELIEWCRGRLTHFKCPASVIFAESLPKGGTGKIQKTALRELYGAPVS